MANIKSAIKRNRQSIVRNARNRSYRSAVLTAGKKLAVAIESGDKQMAVREYSAYTSKLDKACKKGVLPKNTVSRRKSRTAARIAKMA
jgi:small subunit ribosomal protein S20